jgi:hypothetical protein
MALAEAQRSKNPILGDCYGVTFFGKPDLLNHQMSETDLIVDSHTPSRLKLLVNARFLK